MNTIIASFSSYNVRRYGRPWLATVKNGKYDFGDIGFYSASHGEAGDLIVIDPKPNVIYAYGRKDNRGNGTIKECRIWDGQGFIPCDRAGRVKEQNVGSN